MGERKSLYDQFSVVNPEAGVWRCHVCGNHLSSPAEHVKRCPVPDLLAALEASLMVGSGIHCGECGFELERARQGPGGGDLTKKHECEPPSSAVPDNQIPTDLGPDSSGAS